MKLHPPRVVLFGLGFVLASFLSIAARAADDDVTAREPKNLSNSTLVYAGTYTGGKSKGIYLFRLQTQNLDVSQNIMLVPLGLVAETPSPSFMEIDNKRNLLFAVNETHSFEGKPTGGVSAFSMDRATGKLKLLNQKSSLGAGPCHLVLDKSGRYLIVANYDSGSVAVFSVDADGHLGESTDFVQHSGKSVDLARRGGLHKNCVTMSSDIRFAFV
jgi:6-phosphogluconolactonase